MSTYIPEEFCDNPLRPLSEPIDSALHLGELKIQFLIIVTGLSRLMKVLILGCGYTGIRLARFLLEQD
ncbi:MAG TPA: hypothetical protein V6D03_09935, partial [Candidatus Caenarcaniphilales bacterium]